MHQLARVPPALGNLHQTGLEVFAIHHHQANDFLGRGEHGTQSKHQRTEVTIGHEVPGHVSAVAHDVIPVHVGCGVELAHAGDIPIADFARTAQDHVGHHNRVGDLAGTVAIHRVVPVDEEARVRQTDFRDHTAVEQAAFEAQRVHHSVSGRAECGGRDRVRDTQRHNEVVLPVERAAIVIESGSLNHLVLVGPLGQLGNGVRQHGHIVIHHPEPCGAQIIRLGHAGGETARATQVLGLRRIDHALFVAGLVGHGGAPLAGHLAGKRSDHVRRLIGLLIVHDDNAPRCLLKRQNRIEQYLEQLLTFVGGDDQGKLVDGVVGFLHFSHGSHCCT